MNRAQLSGALPWDQAGAGADNMSDQASWYFTAPWDPVPIRRGDALGFRAAADYFADLLAPGLSNATSDARWISLLSWCLCWSHVVWQSAGGRDLARRDDRRLRYAWLRPLELLWVDRTLESGQTTGQLRGRRSIERWRKADRPVSSTRSEFRFAMSPDQFHRYRQVGTYGAYRVVFRTVPQLTIGDGWTPAATALHLATLVNDSLPREVRLNKEHFESGTKWGHWRDGDEARYWVQHGWPTAWQHTGGLLPTSDDAVSKRLPENERQLLEPVLFSTESTRRATADVLAGVKGSRSHADLCETLATSSALSKKLAPNSLTPLPAFSRFADAAMHAMRGLWNDLNHDEAKQSPPVDELASSPDLRARLGMVREAGHAWLGVPGRSKFPHDDVVTRLAKSMQAAMPIDQLRALARHHHEHGGGRRWFREQAGKLVPLVADTGIAASDYRFRLLPLCRLAAQCGVGGMHDALDAMGRSELDGLAQPERVDEEGDAL